MANNLQAALAYARKGWRVFPVKAGAKIPATAHGVKDATSDPDMVRLWWRDMPEANIALACGMSSGVVAIDIDAPSGGHKADGAKSIKAAGLELPDTLTQRTPNGGYHLLYKAEDGIGNATNLNGLAGVDVRGEGGYILLAPSTVDGKPYAWENDGAAVAPFPADMRKRESIRQESRPLQTGLPSLSSVPSGGVDVLDRARKYLATCAPSIQGENGSGACIHAAHALVVGFALDDDTAYALLSGEYNARCVPPWSEKELRHKIESARRNPRKPLGYLRNASPEEWREDDFDESAIADVERWTASQMARYASMLPAAADAMEARYNRRRMLAEFRDPLPDEENPAALFRGRWLRRGGSVVFVSVSGAGKSVMATQAAACWAAGRDCFGITPVKPLKIAVYQAEDDDDEVADFRNNIRRGLVANGWTEAEARATESAIIYHDVAGLTGSAFIRFLSYAQERDKADLLIINPLQAFAGCDISNNAELSPFIRGGLQPVLVRPSAPCACLLVHHTNKIPSSAKDRAGWNTDGAAAYCGAGGAELTNWAREVLAMLPHEKTAGVYRLVAAKRGKRLGWKDAKGAPTISRMVAHSEGVMFWREVDEAELSAVETGRIWAEDTMRGRVVEIVSESGPFKSKADLVAAFVDAGLGKRTYALDVIDGCVRSQKLVAVRQTKGRNVCYYTPEQYERDKPDGVRIRAWEDDETGLDFDDVFGSR